MAPPSTWKLTMFEVGDLIEWENGNCIRYCGIVLEQYDTPGVQGEVHIKVLLRDGETDWFFGLGKDVKVNILSKINPAAIS